MEYQICISDESPGFSDARNPNIEFGTINLSLIREDQRILNAVFEAVKTAVDNQYVRISMYKKVSSPKWETIKETGGVNRT